MEQKSSNKTDVKAEFLRTIACFMVILVHIRVSPIVDGIVLKTPVLIGAVLSTCVGIFFLVTGFFMYDSGRGIWKTAKGFLLKILLPTLFVVFFTLVFENWILGQASFWDCVRNTGYRGVLKAMADGVLHVSSDYWGILCGHLWYIAEHARLVLFFPAMIVVTRYAGTKVLLYLAGLNVFFCFMIDIYRLFGTFSFLYVEPFLRASQALVLVGCLLYRHRERLKEKKTVSFALFIAYLASVLWMFYSQIRQFQTEGGDWPNAYFETWLSGIGMISAILLVAFVLSLPDHLTFWRWIERPARFFGNLSFFIYLVQYAVIMKLNNEGYADRFTVMAVSPWGTAVYYLIYGGLVILISTAVAFIFHLSLKYCLFLPVSDIRLRISAGGRK